MLNNKNADNIARLISSAFQAWRNCQESHNTEWEAKHADRIRQLTADFMPSGAGFDSGTKLDFDNSAADKLIFHTAYHHLNDGGYYDGWTEHKITVRPTFGGFDLKITGRDRNDIKEYIAQTFYFALERVPVWDAKKERYIYGAADLESAEHAETIAADQQAEKDISAGRK